MLKLLLYIFLACVAIQLVTEYFMVVAILIMSIVALVIVFSILQKKGAIPEPIDSACKKFVAFFGKLRTVDVPEEKPTGAFEVEVFWAAGVNYYTQNIMKLAVRNPQWRKQTKSLLADGKAGKNIYRYNFIHKPVKLIPEPTNEHDKNAVIVQIAGEKVGYIRAEEAVHVKEILANRDIKYISSFIGGGEYKIPTEDGDLIRGEDVFTIKVKIGYKA